MKSRKISRSKIGPFSLTCTDPHIGIGWENQSIYLEAEAFGTASANFSNQVWCTELAEEFRMGKQG